MASATWMRAATVVALWAVAAGADDTPPRFEPAGCPSSVASSAGVTCGWLVVPERRSRRPAERMVRLAVAILHAPAPRPGAEPLLYVSGGPGLASRPNA